MSIDMGGPFNKAAYVFGTAQLSEGNFDMMAAVMAGGMVPPLAIALCTTLFKKKFTEKERQSGIVNYIMGLSFITEGAIPFAAQDPLHVIPGCLAGAPGRRLVGAFWLYHKGASWRFVCPSNRRESADVSGSRCRGGGDGMRGSGFFEEGFGTVKAKKKWKNTGEYLIIVSVFDNGEGKRSSALAAEVFWVLWNHSLLICFH